VVNPAAHVKGSAIYGMPILEGPTRPRRSSLTSGPWRPVMPAWTMNCSTGQDHDGVWRRQNSSSKTGQGH
jgi:hypothetical protein